MQEFERRTRDSFARQPAMETFGATLETVREGHAEIHLPYDPRLTQQHGFLYGGLTIRYQRSTLPEEQRASFDSYTGVKKYKELR